MNSCRYYLSRFKDTTRQATLDIMLGNITHQPIYFKVFQCITFMSRVDIHTPIIIMLNLE